jgi:acyl-coenzyme A synthetase/AMP-(fatty) acid ligase
MAWMQRRHGLRPGEVVLHKTTLTFDDAAVELFWPLSVGGCVAMLPPRLHRDPRAMIESLVRHDVVHLNLVPSMLELLLDELSPADRARMPALRSVLSSGEALRPALVARFRDRFGDAVTLDNTWGATEVSIDSTCHTCGPADAASTAASVSLGHPIDANEVFVLDRALDPVPAGAPGELCIGGVGLARGYLDDPVRTAAAFVPHPVRHGERLYRTGDRGRRGADGGLEFLGRADRQVKVRGVRIELGEVEAVMRACPEVADAAATTWSAGPGDIRIACYVVPRPGAGVTVLRLAEHARGQLPSYAVPASFTVLDRLPRLPNGKLDPRGLPPPAPVDPVPGGPAFSTPTERAVARIWAEVLGVAAVGPDDDFFAFGGHSLLAVRATARMIRAFGVDLPVSLIFDHPTVERAASQVVDYVLADTIRPSDDALPAASG